MLLHLTRAFGFLSSTAEAVLRPMVTFETGFPVQNFCRLPLRRYWDVVEAVPSSTIWISVVYRWGGIETSTPAEVVVDHLNISVVYRWGGIETFTSFYPDFQIIHFCRLPLRRYWDGYKNWILQDFACISVVYRWGGIETFFSANIASTSCLAISVVYRWGGIETCRILLCLTLSGGVIKFLLSTAEAVLRQSSQEWFDCRCCNFYCLPLRRYWDFFITKN